jgi:addiction module RelB/DinJ family antitoxin
LWVDVPPFAGLESFVAMNPGRCPGLSSSGPSALWLLKRAESPVRTAALRRHRSSIGGQFSLGETRIISGDSIQTKPAVDVHTRGGQIRPMSESTTIVRTRVPARRLQRAEKILQKLGLTPEEAVNMLMAQIEIRQGLPFEVSTQPRPLLSTEEQAAAWTEAFGAY